jgi:restriction endonuclease S subunit
LKGLEVSEVMLSELEYSGRIDAEYYKPSFLKYEVLIRKKGGTFLSNISNFLIGPFGSSFTVDNYVKEKDFRYIRGKDVKPMKIMDSDIVYIPQKDFIRLSKYALKENDILISVVGTIGNAAIVSEKNLPSIFSCKSTVLRHCSINPKYLVVYLNTKYGKELLLRKERGAIQKGLNIDDLKCLDIFVPMQSFQSSIEIIFNNSLEKEEQSQSLYHKAEELLSETIGLSHFKHSKKGTNIKSFKRSFLTTGRLDAEYYQTKYEEIINKIKTQPHDVLNNLVSIKKSIEPGSDAYSDEGLPFIRLADYGKFGITGPEKYLSDSFCKENDALLRLLYPVKETILFSKDGSVGTAYMMRENMQAVTSGAILHLRVKNKEKVLPEYLTLVLNSKVVQQQAERDVGGSVILHWRVNDIKNVIVPIVDYKIQRQIAELIKQCFSLHAESEQLLNEAKNMVEREIEGM